MMRVHVTAEEFGAPPQGFAPDLEQHTVMDGEGISVPFNKVEELIANLRRIATDLEAMYQGDGWKR